MIRRASVGLALLLAACGGGTHSLSTTTASDHPREDDHGLAATPPEIDGTTPSPDEPSERSASASSDETTSTGPQVDPGTTPDTPPAFPPSGVTEGVRAQMAILERQCIELDLVATQIAAMRPLVAPSNTGMPPVCEDRAPMEALRITSRSGQAGSHAASAALSALDDWCEPFDHWAHPPEAEARTIRSYLQQIDRIVGWMEDIDRCRDATGAERARCENAYDASSREAAAEARRALALLAEHLDELAPVRVGDARFPCRTPVLTRIEAVAWTGTVARAQLSRLGQSAMGVCERLGVAERDVREGRSRTEAALDRAESSARANRRQLLDAIESMRPYLE